MGDYLIKLSNNQMARRTLKSVGVPTPRPLLRTDAAYAAQPLLDLTVLLAGEGRLGQKLNEELDASGANIVTNPDAAPQESGLQGVVFDATGITSPTELKTLYTHFHTALPQLASNARVVIAVGTPAHAASSTEAACRRGVEGFMRSLAKEIGRRGARANLLYVDDDAQDRVAAPLRFLLSAHSAYVDGQPVRIGAGVQAPTEQPRQRPLAGKSALVTGAAQGIGAATAESLAREGATVTCLDIPGAADALEQQAAQVGGRALAVDITADDAPASIASHFRDAGGVDIVVHNAGITRDKTLAKMPEHYWDQLMAINLEAILRVHGHLSDEGLLREQGRVVCLSSMGGIAGNVGQTNYATAKAALIGYVDAEGQRLAERGITMNAVAPGFIETQMTDAMPFMIREGGRRMNALSQGGVPGDVAEVITFLATPGACGVTGQTIRVCGQSLIGA